MAAHSVKRRYSPSSSRYCCPWKSGSSWKTQAPSRTCAEWTSWRCQWSARSLRSSVLSNIWPLKSGRSYTQILNTLEICETKISVHGQGSLCWSLGMLTDWKLNLTWSCWGKIKLDSHFVWSDRTSRYHCIPSSVGSWGSLPWSKRTGNPGNWASHTGPRPHSPLEQSCSAWSGCWARDSRCCTQNNDLGSFCLHRTQSANTRGVTWRHTRPLTNILHLLNG